MSSVYSPDFAFICRKNGRTNLEKQHKKQIIQEALNGQKRHGNSLRCAIHGQPFLPLKNLTLTQNSLVAILLTSTFPVRKSKNPQPNQIPAAIQLMTIPELPSKKKLLDTVKVGNYKVKIYLENDEILIQASGFTIQFPEKPNAAVQTKRDTRPASSLLDAADSLCQIHEIGEHWRAEVRVRIRRDWGEKCFSPDQNGRFQHPLFKGSKSNHFTCLHCNRQFLAAEYAANLWHCPDPQCNGSPIDAQ